MSAKSCILESIFKAFWIPQNAPQIDKKSILEVILGQEGSREISSSANMAPRTDLDRFSIDVSLIWGWIVQALATKLRIPDRRHRPQDLYNIGADRPLPLALSKLRLIIAGIPSDRKNGDPQEGAKSRIVLGE